MTLVSSQSPWKASLTVLYSVAILLTVFRLFHRLRTHRFWWDDGIALFALIVTSMFFGALWARPVVHDLKSRTIVFWVSFLPFILSTCATRVSLALSIARVLPGQHRVRQTVSILVMFLCLACIGIIVGTFLHCQSDTSWRNLTVLCQPAKGLGIAILCEDILSDIYLVITPLWLFWRVRLPPAQKRLILGGFAATTLCTLAAIVSAIVTLRMSELKSHNTQLMVIALHVEVAVSLAVCNFLVVVTFFYGVFHPGQDLELSDTDESTHSAEGRRTTRFDSAPPLSFTRPSEMHLSTIATSTSPSGGSYSISQK